MDEASAEYDEIKVTPEMIVSGLIEFADRDRWGESDDEAVARIYRAMELARRREERPTPKEEVQR